MTGGGRSSVLPRLLAVVFGHERVDRPLLVCGRQVEGTINCPAVRVTALVPGPHWKRQGRVARVGAKASDLACFDGRMQAQLATAHRKVDDLSRNPDPPAAVIHDQGDDAVGPERIAW